MSTEVIARITAGDEHSGLQVNRDCFPFQPPEQVKAVDQNDCLVESDLRPSEGLADAVGAGNRIAVHYRNMQSSWMARCHKRLIQVRQSRDYCAPCSSTTHHQHTHLPFEQLWVDAVNFNDEFLSDRFWELRIPVGFLRHRPGTELGTSSYQQDLSTTQ